MRPHLLTSTDRALLFTAAPPLTPPAALGAHRMSPPHAPPTGRRPRPEPSPRRPQARRLARARPRQARATTSRPAATKTGPAPSPARRGLAGWTRVRRATRGAARSLARLAAGGGRSARRGARAWCACDSRERVVCCTPGVAQVVMSNLRRPRCRWGPRCSRTRRLYAALLVDLYCLSHGVAAESLRARGNAHGTSSTVRRSPFGRSTLATQRDAHVAHSAQRGQRTRARPTAHGHGVLFTLYIETLVSLPIGQTYLFYALYQLSIPITSRADALE